MEDDRGTYEYSGVDLVCVDALEWDEANRVERERRRTESAAPPPPPLAATAKKDGKKVYLYIVMQLCQRESLKSWLRSCTYQRIRRQSLKMFRQICLGVQYVHSQVCQALL